MNSRNHFGHDDSTIDIVVVIVVIIILLILLLRAFTGQLYDCKRSVADCEQLVWLKYHEIAADMSARNSKA